MFVILVVILIPLGGWSSTLSARFRLVISGLALIFLHPVDISMGAFGWSGPCLFLVPHMELKLSLLSKGSFLALRAAILRAVWFQRQPLASAGAVLGMLDGPQGCDHSFCLVWYRFRLFRRYLAFRPAEVDRAYRLLERVQRGCPGHDPIHGPIHALVASAVRIGFEWDPSMPGWRRQGLLGLSSLAGLVQHFRSAILYAWSCRVSAEPCARRGFRCGLLLAIEGSHRLQMVALLWIVFLVLLLLGQVSMLTCLLVLLGIAAGVNLMILVGIRMVLLFHVEVSVRFQAPCRLLSGLSLDAVHLGADHLNVVRDFGRLLDGVEPSRPLDLENYGDLIGLAKKMILSRDPGTVCTSRVKGWVSPGDGPCGKL